MTIIGASKVTYYITRCVISTYKPFYKAMSSDIPSGRVHLDVCWIDQYQPTQWTEPNVADLASTNLGRHAH